MCKAIIAWIPDPTEDNSHNKRPVTCDEYVQSLETRLRYTDPEHPEWLENLQNKLGIK